MNISENPLFQKLISLDLPDQDFAVFGSGPMFPYRLRESIHDIDVVARGKAWDKAKTLGQEQPDKFGNFKVVNLFDGKIEIFNGWMSREWNADELIDTAEAIEGMRFVTLENVLNWKMTMMREKDLKDIELINWYLSRRKA